MHYLYRVNQPQCDTGAQEINRNNLIRYTKSINMHLEQANII